jgi:hypothetical protein
MTGAVDKLQCYVCYLSGRHTLALGNSGVTSGRRENIAVEDWRGLTCVV